MNTNSIRLRLLLTVLVSALVLSTHSAAEQRARVRKLNGELPSGLAGDVTGFTLAPGGRWIVYEADANLDERFELYAVPAGGGAPPRRLCGTLPADADVSFFRVTPDGARVVYVTRTASVEPGALFSVPIDGSAPPLRLSVAPPPGAESLRVAELSSDGRRVVYFADEHEAGVTELFSVPVDGSSPPVRLNAPLLGFGILSARISPDGRSVAYTARQEHDAYELYSVPIEGGVPVRISGPLVAGGNVFQFKIAADGTRVVYRADALVDEFYELFVVPLDGGAAPLRLSALASDGFLDEDFALDGASGRVVFRARAHANLPLELDSVPLDGSASAIRLDASASASGVFRNFTLVPGRGRVLYVASPSSNVDSALFGVPVDGSAPPVQIGGAPARTDINGYGCSADGLRVAFVRETSNGALDLFVANTDGSGAAVKLDRSPFDGYDVASFRIGTTRVAYMARLRGAAKYSLFSAPLDGSTGPILLRAPVEPFGFEIAGQSVAYLADVNSNGVIDLLESPLDGSTPFLDLSGPGALTTVGGIGRFEIAGRHALYLADQDQDGVQELYSAPLDRAGPAVKLNDALDSGHNVSGFQVSPDGASVVFRANPTSATRSELFVAPSDGHARARKLDGSAPFPGGVQADFRFSPDGRRVVYSSNESTSTFFDVCSVPSDASAPALHVFGFYSGEEFSFVISPDSTRLVMRVEIQRDRRRDLWGVPLDGSTNARPVAFLSNRNGDITDFDISADSRWVVYRADDDIDDHFQLCSASIDGGTVALDLALHVIDFDSRAAGGRVVFRAHGPDDRIELYATLADGSAAPTRLAAMDPSRRVRPFVLSPDGARVAYRADADMDERYELFSVPSDGSAAPVKLSFASRADTDVPGFGFTPDSAHVLFLADTLRNEQDDLYVVPADRSAPPRRLNPALAVHRSVLDFTCSADSAWVAFRSNLASEAQIELFRAPLDGSVPAVRMSAPLVADGNVRDYRFASPAELVYTSDQDADDVVELFTSTFGERTRAR